MTLEATSLKRFAYDNIYINYKPLKKHFDLYVISFNINSKRNNSVFVAF